jgi:regulator of replication initiation timing
VSTHPYQREIEDLRSRLVAATARVAELTQENVALRERLYNLDIAETNEMLARRNENLKRKA